MSPAPPAFESGFAAVPAAGLELLSGFAHGATGLPGGPVLSVAMPLALAASVAAAGAFGARVFLRKRREGAKSSVYAAGLALAERHPEPLEAMPALGLGTPRVVRADADAARIVVTGIAPPGGCAFRAGYLAGALGAPVRERIHRKSACEFEMLRR